MSRYDLTRASDLVLLAAVRATIGAPHEARIYAALDATTRRALEAFAAVLVDSAQEDFQELEALRAECRLKTQAEYDREIGATARATLAAGEWESDPKWLSALRALVDASRSAPEGEP